jgi:hypothetical protein
MGVSEKKQYGKNVLEHYLYLKRLGLVQSIVWQWGKHDKTSFEFDVDFDCTLCEPDIPPTEKLRCFKSPQKPFDFNVTESQENALKKYQHRLNQLITENRLLKKKNDTLNKNIYFLQQELNETDMVTQRKPLSCIVSAEDVTKNIYKNYIAYNKSFFSIKC